VLFTTPSEKPLRNPGLAWLAIAGREWAVLAARTAGRASSTCGKNFQPALRGCSVHSLRLAKRAVPRWTARSRSVWALTLDAAKRKGLRVAFRIQLSNTSSSRTGALPPFLRDHIPLVTLAAFPAKVTVSIGSRAMTIPNSESIRRTERFRESHNPGKDWIVALGPAPESMHQAIIR